MEETEGSFKFAACSMVLNNTLYRQASKPHENCSACIGCQGVSYFSNMDSNDIEVCLEKLANSHPDSPEGRSFNNKITVVNKCKCSCSWGKRKTSSISFTVPKLDEPLSIDSILGKIKVFQVDKCCNKNCSYNKIESKFKVEGDITNVLIKLDWESRDLKTLYNFVIEMTSVLNLQKFKKEGSLYMQGMIVKNKNRYLYIQLDPCVIFSKPGKETSIYIDYLIFSLFQYSYFPVVLVFNSVETQINLRETVKKYEGAIKEYVKFLTGETSLDPGICFYCWNESHDYCLQTNNELFWRCQCRLFNSKTTLFCNNCNASCRQNENLSWRLCGFCGSNLNSIYCPSCSVIGNCTNCQSDVLKTQSFVCFYCKNWMNSSNCDWCKKLNPEILCWKCFRQSGKDACKHNKGTSCLLCYYDKKCGVCWKPLTVNQKKYCWKCRSVLVQGICLTCQVYLPSNSMVCTECLNSNKKCKLGHLVTGQSNAYCSECKESQFNKIVSNEKYCVECHLDLQGLPSNCTLCDHGFKDQHDCDVFKVCCFCIKKLEVCSCGCKLVSSSKICTVCKKSALIRDFKARTPFESGERGPRCKICDFSNLITGIFCENCDYPINSVYSNRSQCDLCGKLKTGDYCFRCFKNGSCAECFKDILISQDEYCKQCKSKLYNRVCKKCQIIAPLSSILCFICSSNSWECHCGFLNLNSSLKCESCNFSRFETCEICKNQLVVSQTSWRNQSEKRLKYDRFVCQPCSEYQKQCSCGCKVLETESICPSCDLEIDN